jgi:hypothetical protein
MRARLTAIATLMTLAVGKTSSSFMPTRAPVAKSVKQTPTLPLNVLEADMKLSLSLLGLICLPWLAFISRLTRRP